MDGPNYAKLEAIKQKYFRSLDKKTPGTLKKWQIKKLRKKKPKRRLVRPEPLQIRPDYYEYITSRRWRRYVRWIKMTRGHKCEKCRSQKNLQVHHLIYKRLGKENDSDVQLLCRECHEHAHQFQLDVDSHMRAITGL